MNPRARNDREPGASSGPRLVVPAPPAQRVPAPPAQRTAAPPAQRTAVPQRPATPAAQRGIGFPSGGKPAPGWDSALAPAAAPQHAPATAWQQARETAAVDQAAERGLPGWGALLVLIAIAGLGGVIDTITGTSARGGFNIGIIVASVVAIIAVRHSAMFPIVVAPPIVYSVASGILLYARSDGLHDKKVLIDTAANWLVYGFPAIAAATAAVLIIAGIRLITRR